MFRNNKIPLCLHFSILEFSNSKIEKIEIKLRIGYHDDIASMLQRKGLMQIRLSCPKLFQTIKVLPFLLNFKSKDLEYF